MLSKILSGQVFWYLMPEFTYGSLSTINYYKENKMKIKRILFYVIVLIMLAGIINVEPVNAATLPPNEPWKTEVVDATPYAFPGQYVSIAHHPISGRAYISYYDAEYEELIMAREVAPGTGDCYGNHDWDCTIVTYGNDVGRYSSIDVDWVVPGGPTMPYTKVGISYYDATQKSLMYAQTLNPAGGWTTWTKQEIDDSTLNSNVRGTYSSLKFTSDHKPVIAYHYSSYTGTGFIGGVKIASFNSSGTGAGCYGEYAAYWDCDYVSSLMGHTDYGIHVSLDLAADDTIHIGFYDSFNSRLVWATYWGFGGSCDNNEWNCVIVDGAGDVGQFVSIHAPKSSSDKLRFAYFDNTTSLGRVKYAVQVSSGGNCTSSIFNCFDVDQIGDPAGHIGISLSVDKQGYPIIAYMDASSSFSATKLKVARPALAYGITYGNCGEVSPGDLFLYWQCDLVDPGYQDIVNEAAFAAVSVSPAGLATIAYYEYDSYNDVGRLKVAQQYFTLYLPLIKK